MPEGDTIFRAARAMHRALAGGVVTRFESVFPKLTRVDVDRHLAGRTIASVTARGKHLLIAFSGDLTLRTHMRMHGSWHLYRPGERWRRPHRDMRVVIETAAAVAVAFNVPIAEWLTSRDLPRHEELNALGPDLLDSEFNRAAAIARLRLRTHDPIGDALLNQRVVAGVGNVFKSEILFLARVDPFTAVERIAEESLAEIVEIARRLLKANVLTPSQTLCLAAGRRTTASLNPRDSLWVYGRGGKPCRVCGTLISTRKTGPYARLTYWCSRCQPATR